MSIDFSKVKNVHFIGIGGIGISAIARMLHLEGKKVTGSDRSASEVTHELEKIGINVMIGQKAENVKPKTDLVIYTIAIPQDNPELVKTKALKIPHISYPEALGIISKGKYTIAIAGTHGKTTTTAMIAKLLIDTGMDPTVIVGSFLKDQKSNFIAGKSKYLVVEACEYKRSFLNLTPKILVITNIDNDHLDYYKDMEDIKSAFIELVEKIPENGFLVCNCEQPHIADIIKKAKCTVVDYELFWDVNLKLKIPGEHNLSNAAAALAVADSLGLSRKDSESSLKKFSGTWRRFDYKGKTTGGALVYDDYGHHPTEIRATLKGAREMFPSKRIVVAFQPHLYSRTKQHFKEFGESFQDADEVILAPIYGAREKEDSEVSSALLATEIAHHGHPASALTNLDSIAQRLEASHDDDVVITMGAGDIYTVAEKIAHAPLQTEE
jgi:UDP-N-acetylmuramate--alanine ligase